MSMGEDEYMWQMCCLPYDPDQIIWSDKLSLADQKYQDSERLLKETDDKGQPPF